MTTRLGRWPAVQRDDGAVAILVAVLVTFVLVPLVAFSVDFGLAYTARSTLQSAVDAAALAGASRIAALSDPSQPCSTTPPAIQAAGVAAAEGFFDTHADNGGTGPWDRTVTTACVGETMTVQVVGTGTTAAVFGGIFGVDDYTVGRQATAAVGTPQVVEGMLPFSLCRRVPGGGPEGFDLKAPGCPGLVVGPVDAGAITDSEVASWLANGFSAIMELDGQTLRLQSRGLPAAGTGPDSVGDALDELVRTQRIVVLPIYGAPANPLNVTGLQAVRLCGWQLEDSPTTGRNSNEVPGHCGGPFPTGPMDTDFSPALRLTAATLPGDSDGYLAIADVTAYCAAHEDAIVCGTPASAVRLVQ
ncbi:MAG: hypothetical protein EPO13_00805 [Actinomycetota bacterium]|nr:MAG: hypothetical protein EPO13_00805 [Actinomycetota bacterium]